MEPANNLPPLLSFAELSCNAQLTTDPTDEPTFEPTFEPTINGNIFYVKNTGCDIGLCSSKNTNYTQLCLFGQQQLGVNI